jgi:hypothetical protein
VKTRTVKRHWCDFCNKAGLQAHAMTKHEKHCTLNPARDCRVCGLMGGAVHVGAERMAQLVGMLPDATEYLAASWYDNSKDNVQTRLLSDLATAMPKLREEVNNCPACIMAALRQRKIPVPMVDGFDFKSEMKSILDDVAAERWPGTSYDY